ncbi:MAG: T9SS type A sorting domain-containing protein [Melioribacteraceae bacterium]|nr:T9SS type A sorting domain-containing protein [Melioribacteraceae bacterium]
MKRFSIIFMFFTLIFITQINAQLFNRTALIKEPSGKEGGFGGIIAGVDFDKDGNPEIYACNTNMVDRDYELIPRIYKFEWNRTTSTWDSVWSATAPLTLQNTWPAFTWGDLDKDGKPEIYWAPVNYSPYPDVPRILVYEYPGDGSDNMGVSDGLGGFMPNAATNILPGAGLNIRPFKFVIADPDGDGKDELIFSDRSTAAPQMWFGVLSVNNIPDLGGGTETWTVEHSGQGVAEFTGSSSKYDVAVIGSVVYLFDGGTGGRVFGVKYANNAWQTPKVQRGIAGGNSSFKGAKIVDINKDGKNEILLAEWLGSAKGQGAKVWLLQQVADTLTSTEITDVESLGVVRLNGADAGDLDGDGKLDFVFAARDDANNSTKVPIFRVEYQGGDIANPFNYVTSIIDSAYWDKRGDMDVVVVANVDGDASDEVLYTQGYTRGNSNDDPMPIVILDAQFTPVSVERISENIPADFFLEQNFPNPFNPSTQIKFGILHSSDVELKVFDLLGREVAILIDNELYSAGTYVVNFDAGNLASGIYIYRLTSGNNIVSKKMQLLK